MQNEMRRQRFIDDGGSSSLSEVSVIATEYKPALKLLGYRNSGGLETQDSDDSCQRMSIGEQESEISDDDDIEDW